MLGDVTDQGKTIDDPTVRGNELGGIALDYHTDGSDLVGLLCLRTARTGGLSCVANAVAIHNELVREHPELAAALYEPLPYDARGEQADGHQAVLHDPRLHRARRPALRALHPASTSWRRSATPTRRASARRPAGGHRQGRRSWPTTPTSTSTWTCSPGEMQFINNYHVLHGRTAYEDDVAHGYKRHLKRLWLATYELTDRPAHFAALGRTHWEAKRSVSTLPAVDRVSTGS